MNVRAHFNTKGVFLKQRPIPLTSPDLKASLQYVGGATSMPSHRCLNLGAGELTQVPGKLRRFLV